MNTQPPPVIAVLLLIAGTLGAMAGLFALSRQMEAKRGPKPDESCKPWRWRVAIGLLAILILAAGLRFIGLENRGMTHVEVYVPGLLLPEGISTPPPRHSFGDVLWYHFHDEPHPMGFYVLMYGWTKAFGTTLQSIRLPSLIFNVLSIALLFSIVRKEVGHRAAFLAALIMAFHGHQVFWSQQARMYAMGEFFGLLSTCYLLSMIRGENKKHAEIIYVLASLAGVATKIFYWPFLAAQMLLVASVQDQAGKPYRRLMGLQAIVVILGTPLWTHALYRARHAPLAGPSPKMVAQFLGLGNLFEDDFFSMPIREAPLLPLMIAICLTVAGFVMAGRPKNRKKVDCPGPLRSRLLTQLAISSAVFISGLAIIAHRRQMFLLTTALLPLAALALPGIQNGIARVVGGNGERLMAKNQALPFLILALTPFVLLMGVGVLSPILKTRGMITFVPYLVAAVAIGWSRFLTKPLGVVAVFCLFAWPLSSSLQFFSTCQEPNDHRSITRKISESFREDDLIFVKGNDWVTTPSLYHLFAMSESLVGEDWTTIAAANPNVRVWVLSYSDIPPPDDLTNALLGRRILRTHSSRRCRAHLYSGVQ